MTFKNFMYKGVLMITVLALIGWLGKYLYLVDGEIDWFRLMLVYGVPVGIPYMFFVIPWHWDLSGILGMLALCVIVGSLIGSFIAVSAIIMPFCSFSHASYFTLRSGGKTMVTFLFDSVFTWIVVVPTSFLLARYTGLGIVSVYFLVQATEVIKVVIGYFMVKSDVWLVQMV